MPPIAVVLAMVLCLASGATYSATGADATTAAKLERGYIRAEKPSVRIPPYLGDRYEDTVPDTLELAEMARLAINGLTGPLDPAAGEELYFEANWCRNPPVMTHDFSDWCVIKFLGPMVLMRIICGSNDNLDVQKATIETYLRSVGPDGLFHIPKAGRDWQLVHLWDEVKPQSPPPPEDYGGGGIFSVYSRWIEAAWLYHARDPGTVAIFAAGTVPIFVAGGHKNGTVPFGGGQKTWGALARQMANTAMNHMTDKGDFAYCGGGDKVPTGFLGADGWIIQALAQHYRVTGDQRAKNLARKLVHWQRDHANFFREDGSFVFDRSFAPSRGGAHFHVHSNCLLGFLEYALAAKDQEVLAYVRKSYEWARRQGVPLVGFFPETVRPNCPNSEGCPVSDMVALAVKFSASGAADYWDDVDRWVRNYFSEIQLTPDKAAYLDRFAHGQPRQPVASNETADRVTERNIGAFAGWPGPNDWLYARGIQHCCTGNCTRAIYYVWENTLTFHDHRLAVNLLLNRASPWADVYSCIPYEGRVEVRVKQDLADLTCRMPEWIASCSRQVACAVEGGKTRSRGMSQFSSDENGTVPLAGVKGRARTPVWNGRHVSLGPAKRGERFVVTFPISERTVKERIGGIDCTLVIKGNTVVSVDPPGKNCPLYRRARFHANTTPWHKVNRFVSQETIQW